jgi:dipeptidyl aminopeptidase/acylaminoacyl peptidase
VSDQVSVHERRAAPGGSWPSPVTAELIVSGSVRPGQAVVDGKDVYWTEDRPAEDGRTALVTARPGGGEPRDVLRAGVSVRTRVHEYGGGAFTVARGEVFFTDAADQRLYRCRAGEDPAVLTAPGLRHADLLVDTDRRRLLAVREDHTTGARYPDNTLISIPLDGPGEAVVLAAGHDFVSSPRLSPDGRHLAYLTWDHPDMPWDATTLWLARLTPDGTVAGEPVALAGGPGESITQPLWSPDGTLFYVGDRTGWWNLYRCPRDPSGAPLPPGPDAAPLCPARAEFGVPQWVLGIRGYGFLGPDTLICSLWRDGLAELALVDAATGQVRPIEQPYRSIGTVLPLPPDRVVLIGGAPELSTAVAVLDVRSAAVTVLRQAESDTVGPDYLSRPETVRFATDDGADRAAGEPPPVAYGFYYPPRNAEYRLPDGQRPPLVVHCHGGPTSAASSARQWTIQYWTSRGIAVLDVNYRGSTGFGRDYRGQLAGRWGIADVRDCVNGARYLAARGDVDPARLAITGGSAGGFTTLAALAFDDTFRAGASHYGVSDLTLLAEQTHKFESRYLDGLIGPYPQCREEYLRRSPVTAADRVSAPVVFFQGLDDPVVPPNQAELMVAALRARGIPVAYVPFAGERHGFRTAAAITRALTGELYFYSRIFSFTPADPITPIPIHNLPNP